MRRWLTTDMYDAENVPEHLDIAAVIAEGRACGSLGDRPLAVVHAGKYVRDPELSQEMTVAISILRGELHRDLVRLSSRSLYFVAGQSDHFVQFDQPGLVVDAVRRVVEMVRVTDRRQR